MGNENAWLDVLPGVAMFARETWEDFKKTAIADAADRPGEGA